MRIQTPSSRTFVTALAAVAKCISPKNSIAILDTILLSQAEDGRFFITGGSAEAMLTIPVDLSIVEGSWNNSVCLPTKMIIPFLQTLPDIVVTFEFVEKNKFTIHYCTTAKATVPDASASGGSAKNGKVDMPYIGAMEYPKFPKMEETIVHIALPGAVLSNQVSLARTFAADDELRPVMNNVVLDVKYDECTIVATDGHRLYKHVHSNADSDFYRKAPKDGAMVMLNKKAIAAMSVFAECEEVNIETDGKRIIVYADDMTYTMTVCEGRYPNYNSVIPHNQQFVTVSKKEMLAVLKRVSLCCPETTHLIVLNYDGSMFLTIKAEDIDFAKASEDQVLITQANMQSNLRIGFKSTILAECINACDSEEVTIWLADSSRAAVIKPSDPNTPMLALCMPMMMND